MVEPGEERSHVVGAFFLALQSCQAGRQCDSCRLGLELHYKRQVQEVLFSRYEGKGAIFLDGSAHGTAKLVLAVDRRVAEGVR